jgi:acetyltransferase-like isoleucine patch superfamily enzyme
MSTWKHIFKYYKIHYSKPIQKRYPFYKIGRGTYGNPTIFSWDESSTLEIGAYCSISDNVNIFLGGEHRTDWVTTYPFNIFLKTAKNYKGHPKTKGNVIIGNDVWVGYGATILSGTNIGDGAVIGAQSVVTKNVSPYSIVAGNPAKEIRKRFSNDIIERLLAIKWWELDDKIIESIIPLLLNNNVEHFLSCLENMKSSI